MEGLTLIWAALLQEPETIFVEVNSAGAVEIEGKILFEPKPFEPEEEDTRKLADFFEARRQMEIYQTVKGKDDFVNYTVVLRPCRDTPFRSIQQLYMIASMHGGVTQIKLAFPLDAKEGKDILTALQKDRSLAWSRSPAPEFQDVRIRICVCDDEGERERHGAIENRHDERLEGVEQSDLEKTAQEDPPHLILNDVCIAHVEKNETGRLYKSRVCVNHVEVCGLAKKDRIAANLATYREIAARAKELRDLIPNPGPILVDADGAVPYEHVLGVMNACRELGIDHFEFTPDQRLDRYYGLRQKGEFKNWREKKK